MMSLRASACTRRLKMRALLSAHSAIDLCIFSRGAKTSFSRWFDAIHRLIHFAATMTSQSTTSQPAC